jgi:hypothetical protein
MAINASPTETDISNISGAAYPHGQPVIAIDLANTGSRNVPVRAHELQWKGNADKTAYRCKYGQDNQWNGHRSGTFMKVIFDLHYRDIFQGKSWHIGETYRMQS